MKKSVGQTPTSDTPTSDTPTSDTPASDTPTSDNNYDNDTDTTAEEREIDLMVYKLYELTYDEVKIIEPDFAMSREEYENFKMEE